MPPPARVPGVAPSTANEPDPQETLKRLTLPITLAERQSIIAWFDKGDNAHVEYTDSTGHTATLMRGNIEPLLEDTSYLGGDIMELLVASFAAGNTDGIPGIAPYAAGFHTALLSLDRDDPMPPRGYWAALYRRAVPALAKAPGAECGEAHTGICIPVYTIRHWVLLVLHLSTASFTVYDSNSSPQHPLINAAISTVKFRLEQLAAAQSLSISWGDTHWVPPTLLAQQYDVAVPRSAGGDCLLFVSCWTLCILAGDVPTRTSVQQRHMRNIRDQVLLLAIQADVAVTRRRLLDSARPAAPSPLGLRDTTATKNPIWEETPTAGINCSNNTAAELPKSGTLTETASGELPDADVSGPDRPATTQRPTQHGAMGHDDEDADDDDDAEDMDDDDAGNDAGNSHDAPILLDAGDDDFRGSHDAPILVDDDDDAGGAQDKPISMDDGDAGPPETCMEQDSEGPPLTNKRTCGARDDTLDEQQDPKTRHAQRTRQAQQAQHAPQAQLVLQAQRAQQARRALAQHALQKQQTPPAQQAQQAEQVQQTQQTPHAQGTPQAQAQQALQVQQTWHSQQTQQALLEQQTQQEQQAQHALQARPVLQAQQAQQAQHALAQHALQTQQAPPAQQAPHAQQVQQTQQTPHAQDTLQAQQERQETQQAQRILPAVHTRPPQTQQTQIKIDAVSAAPTKKRDRSEAADTQPPADPTGLGSTPTEQTPLRGHAQEHSPCDVPSSDITKTRGRQKRPLDQPPRGDPSTPAPRRGDTSGERPRLLQKTAFNKANDTSDKKQGHDPYG
jgi:hypothetical protein